MTEDVNNSPAVPFEDSNSAHDVANGGQIMQLLELIFRFANFVKFCRE